LCGKLWNSELFNLLLLQGRKFSIQLS